MKNKNLVKAVLAAASAYLYINIAVFMVAFQGIVKAYSDHNPVIVNMVYLIPNLVTIPFILISGKLCTWFSKKSLLITGLIIFALAGTGAMLYENIIYVMIMRALLGVGMGILYPLARALAVQYFEGKERTSVLGLMQATTCGFGIVLAPISGQIAMINYRYTMLIYLIALLIAIFAAVVLPKDTPERLIYQETEGKQILPGYGTSYFIFLAGVFVVSIFLVVNQLKLSIFVTSQNLGTSADVGLINSIIFIAGFFAGLLFSKFYSLTKRYSVVIACLIDGIGLLIVYKAYSLIAVYIGNVLIGAFIGVMQPYFTTRVSALVPKARATMAITYLGVVYSFSYFSASYIVPVLESIFKASDVRASYLLFGVFSIVCAVVSCLWILFTKSNKEAKESC